jgi:hypothetical protein
VTEAEPGLGRNGGPSMFLFFPNAWAHKLDSRTPSAVRVSRAWFFLWRASAVRFLPSFDLSASIRLDASALVRFWLNSSCSPSCSSVFKYEAERRSSSRARLGCWFVRG